MLTNICQIVKLGPDTEVLFRMIKDGQRLKVVLVDDDADIREVLQRMLISLGIAERNILEASNGEEAIRVIIEAKRVDLIVSDIRMPKMDGITLVRRLITFGIYTPVVLVSGNAEELMSDAKDLPEIGEGIIRGVLHKPVSTVAFGLTIESALTKAQGAPTRF